MMKGKRGIHRSGLLLLLLGIALMGCQEPRPHSDVAIYAPSVIESEAQVFAQFEAELEHLRQVLKIPGMSAAIVHNQELVWARGFGYADLENRIAATPDTPYHLASVTKPIAATIIMQLVEEGVLDLDDPVSRYGVHLESQGTVRVWHLLTHTSEGVPGSRFDYDGERYALLGRVIEGASGKPFGELLSERILGRLGMTHTAPNPSWGWRGFMATLGLGQHYGNFARVYAELAKPYQFDASYNIVPGRYSLHFSPAAGLLSSVADLAKFDIALDQNLLVRPETKEQMFTPALSNTGLELPYGLGWELERYKDLRLIRHGGRWPPSVSALYLKVPEENLTFIILANTDNLSTPHPMGEGDVLLSTVALAFYETFVFPRQYGQTVPQVDWEADERDLVSQLQQVTDVREPQSNDVREPQSNGEAVREILERELWSYRQIFASVGRTELCERLLDVHGQVYPQSRLKHLWRFTSVPSATPQPVPTAVGAYDLVRANLVWLAWFILTVASLIFLTGALVRGAPAPWGMRLAWVWVTVIFGPLGLLAYLLACRQPGRSPDPLAAMTNWRRALGATVYSVAGNVTGLILMLAFYYFFLPTGDVGPVILLAPFVVGLLVFRAPLVASLLGSKYRVAVRQSLLAEIISASLVLAGTFPVLFLLSKRWFPDLGLDSPLFWGFVSLGAVTGALIAYPFNLWMARHGFSFWPVQVTATAESTHDSRRVTPSLRSAWGALLFSLVLLVASLGLTIQSLA